MSNSSDLEILLEEGRERFDSGDFLGALDKFQRAIEQHKQVTKIKPDYADVYLNCGLTLSKLKRYEEAIEQYKKATKINPDYVEAYLSWGNALESLQRYEKAIEQYRQATKISPNYADAYLNCGLALSKLKRYEEAIEQYKKVTNKEPQNADAYLNWADALQCLKEYENALKKYELATNCREKFINAYNNWGVTLSKLKRYEEAIEKYKIIIKINAKHIAAHVNWGIALEKKFCYEQAIEKYETIIRENKVITDDNRKDITKAFNRYGEVFRSLNRHIKSTEIYKRAIDLGLEDFYIYFYYGLALASLNRYEESIEKYKRAIELNPIHPYPYHNIAIAFWQRGKYQKGWTYWRKAYHAYRSYEYEGRYDREIDFFYYFGYVLHEILGELDEAEKIYQEGLKLDDKSVCLRSSLADLYQEKKDETNSKKNSLSENLVSRFRNKENIIQSKSDFHWKSINNYREAIFVTKIELSELNSSDNSDKESSAYWYKLKNLNSKIDEIRK